MSGKRSAPAIALRDVAVTYEGRTVLDVDQFDLPPGETFAVLGTSGAGKSTLLRVAGLLERPTKGRVLVDGREAHPRDRALRGRMAAVFQQPCLFTGTVADNVGYGLRLRRVEGAERERRVEAALERVGLAGRGGDSALTLSGGEARRAALARALVVEPEVLLLDEPLSSVDPMTKTTLTDEFARILRVEGVTTLYVTHDQDEALVVADHIGIMHDGRFVRSGNSTDVMSMPASEWVAGFLGMEPPLRGKIVSAAEGLVGIDCGGVHVFAMSPLPVGSEALVAVRPEDVTLFGVADDVPASSARNRVRGTIAEMALRGATVRVVIESGEARIAALLSRAAVADLRLEIDREVLALFKATATRVSGVGV